MCGFKKAFGARMQEVLGGPFQKDLLHAAATGQRDLPSRPCLRGVQWAVSAVQEDSGHGSGWQVITERVKNYVSSINGYRDYRPL